MSWIDCIDCLEIVESQWLASRKWGPAIVQASIKCSIGLPALMHFSIASDSCETRKVSCLETDFLLPIRISSLWLWKQSSLRYPRNDMRFRWEDALENKSSIFWVKPSPQLFSRITILDTIRAKESKSGKPSWKQYKLRNQNHNVGFKTVGWESADLGF